MIKRYKYTKVDKNADGKRYYEATVYPKIEKKIDDIYIISKRGDRLDIFAKRYYDDARAWWIIAQANHLGKGTLIVEPGLQLRIPMDISNLDNNLEKINEEL